MVEENLKLEDLLGKNNFNDEAINSVAIIGAGIMGQGIAQTVSSSGIDVVIIEKNEANLNNAKESLADSIDNEIKRWTLTQSEKKAIFSRISWELSIEKVKECDLIIEAVDEDFELKKDIFKTIDNLASADTVFISNTSTLSLTKIAESTKRSNKIIGMRSIVCND